MPHPTAPPPDDEPAEQTLAKAYLAVAQQELCDAADKIEHCLVQLGDADLQWTPHASHNSVQTIILHLGGNLRQWIGHGIGGAEDVRDRPQEFVDRPALSGQALVELLREAVEDACGCLNRCPPEDLLQPRRIQGMETTVLAAIFDSVSHFVGHTHQIVYIARLRLGDRYLFQWQPSTAEQGAS